MAGAGAGGAGGGACYAAVYATCHCLTTSSIKSFAIESHMSDLVIQVPIGKLSNVRHIYVQTSTKRLEISGKAYTTPETR